MAFDVTLTLSGIAGIILSIGMAVDANVIIFTRIQGGDRGWEQPSRICDSRSGFTKALSAIIDGNVTTLIAAVVLYWMRFRYRQGLCARPWRSVSSLSMFTALFVTKSDPELHFMRWAFAGCEVLRMSQERRRAIRFPGQITQALLCILSAVVIIAGRRRQHGCAQAGFDGVRCIKLQHGVQRAVLLPT